MLRKCAISAEDITARRLAPNLWGEAWAKDVLSEYAAFVLSLYIPRTNTFGKAKDSYAGNATVKLIIIKIKTQKGNMQEKTFTKKQKKQIESYLKSFSINNRLIRMEKYEQDYFKDKTLMSSDILSNEVSIARAKMFEIRHFILSLDNCDEKLLLYFHYIKEESVERCAEMMGISARSAFRLKRRALELAYNAACLQNIRELL